MSSGLYLGTLPSRKWMGYYTASAAASLWFELQELSEIQGYKYTHSHTHTQVCKHTLTCMHIAFYPTSKVSLHRLS